MPINRYFKLYLNAGRSIPLVINANQNDKDEQWYFSLFTETGEQYFPDAGAIVGIKCDGKLIDNEATVDSRGYVIVTETAQMTAVPGKNIFELQLNEHTHGTANFIVLVQPSPTNGGVLSDSDLSLFQQAINSIAIAGSGAPAVATTASEMIDTGKIYLYAGSETGYTAGDWYYYNGSAWTDGGKYGGTVDSTLTIPGAAADAKKVGDELIDLKSEIAQSEGGLTSAIKSALMQFAQNVAFKNTNGQTYVDDLYDALYPPVVYTAITLDKNSLSFGSLNTTQQLVATTTPVGGAVTWSSSDSTVATVSSTGLVTSIGYGNATITASCGDLSATCSVAIAQATVTSISANYTQSGTVYDTASLDDLKNDLVVTATWSNQTTSTVASADYTLSGTLAVGTSVITVSYGGKTATFNVNVLHDSTVLGYVGDGLIAMWDGIKNAGINAEHDSTLKSWIDVVDGVTLANSDTGTTFSFDSNYMQFSPNSMGNTIRPGNALSANISTFTRTVEVLFKTDDTSNAQFIANLTGDITGIADSGLHIFGITPSDGTVITKANEADGRFTIDMTKANCVTAIYDTSNACTGYVNGASATVSPNAHSFSIGSGYDKSALRVGSSPYYPFKGKIYSIRLYDRELSASEIAANYANDVTRFGLGS